VIVRPRVSDLLPFARLNQARLTKLFQENGITADRVKRTLALDVAYSGDSAYSCGVAFDIRKRKVTGIWRLLSHSYFPYVPGYLYLREAPPLLKLMETVDADYDLLLVDAHGRLHPRGAGLATVLGVLLEKPTVGIAKSLLVGTPKERGKVSPVFLGGKMMGFRVSQSGIEYYASQGNMISLHEVRSFLRLRRYIYPQELALVDAETKKFKRSA
jgi:deoxyribonuclease V